MSRVIQKQGMASGLFSSALFCLWLSTASLVVWVDFSVAATSQVSAARQQAANPGAIKHD